MAKKQVNGQVSLFDYINLIQNQENYGNVEMVSLMPEQEVTVHRIDGKEDHLKVEDLNVEDLNVVDLNDDVSLDIKEDVKEDIQEDIKETHNNEIREEIKKDSDKEILGEKPPVMSKYFVSKSGEKAFVEYRDYNRVLIQDVGEELKEIHFQTSKEAVDCYINHMYQMMDNKELKEL